MCHPGSSRSPSAACSRRGRRCRTWSRFRCRQTAASPRTCHPGSSRSPSAVHRYSARRRRTSSRCHSSGPRPQSNPPEASPRTCHPGSSRSPWAADTGSECSSSARHARSPAPRSHTDTSARRTRPGSSRHQPGARGWGRKRRQRTTGGPGSRCRPRRWRSLPASPDPSRSTAPSAHRRRRCRSSSEVLPVSWSDHSHPCSRQGSSHWRCPDRPSDRRS